MVGNLTDFSTQLGNYYSCDSSTNISLNKDVSLSMKSVKLQVFRNKNETGFYGEENKCSSGSPDNPVDTVIPIVVGCVLGGLVIIVVIGYIIGRRRARAQNNYETLP
ncbi:LAMP5 [Bugula neritina]|uniref:LAMP5 n=1 Tax=Bugula neritina TaxID=10212 RepID=A0A7J7KJB5_BUGNE|nr:LAMP5 [Bugula neritina]